MEERPNQEQIDFLKNLDHYSRQEIINPYMPVILEYGYPARIEGAEIKKDNIPLMRRKMRKKATKKSLKICKKYRRTQKLLHTSIANTNATRIFQAHLKKIYGDPIIIDSLRASIYAKNSYFNFIPDDSVFNFIPQYTQIETKSEEV